MTAASWRAKPPMTRGHAEALMPLLGQHADAGIAFRDRPGGGDDAGQLHGRALASRPRAASRRGGKPAVGLSTLAPMRLRI
jgi:hypothetical protein